MKAKTLIILAAGILAIGSIVAFHGGGCPLQCAKPSQTITK
jgi:hypothetical protein